MELNEDKHIMGTNQDSAQDIPKTFTINSFKDKLIEQFKTKKNGEPFKDQDIYQYIYRRQIPKIYGGQQINLTSESGIIQFILTGGKETYLERRGRRKGTTDTYKRAEYPKKIKKEENGTVV